MTRKFTAGAAWQCPEVALNSRAHSGACGDCQWALTGSGVPRSSWAPGALSGSDTRRLPRPLKLPLVVLAALRQCQVEVELAAAAPPWRANATCAHTDAQAGFGSAACQWVALCRRCQCTSHHQAPDPARVTAEAGMGCMQHLKARGHQHAPKDSESPNRRTIAAASDPNGTSEVAVSCRPGSLTRTTEARSVLLYNRTVYTLPYRDSP